MKPEKKPSDPNIAKREAMNTKNRSTPLGSISIREKRPTRPPMMTKAAVIIPGNNRYETENGEL